MEKQFRKRNAILSYLRGTAAHPSAETVYAGLKPQIPDLSLGTVYRNLALFRKKGLVTSVATVDGTERFDADTAPHAHFICTRCGAVSDLQTPDIPDLIRAAHTNTGADINGCQLSFTGVCSKCLRKKP